MILIDALYIHVGGPKTLLDYLIIELEKTEKNIVYLLDKRVVGNVVSIKSSNRIVYQKASLKLRQKFYKKEKNNFTTVLCLGNIPPPIRLKATVYTYFHNSPFVQTIKSFSVKNNILFLLKRRVVNHFKKNTDFWIVQINLIKQQLQQKYRLDNERILVLPFYEPINSVSTNVEKIKDQYVYVSLGTPYKNHLRLIQAFCKFHDKYKQGKLILTLSQEYRQIIELIENKKQLNYPIENVGYVNREAVKELLLQSEYHIYPSLTESLGLGIVESIDCGCKVIGADLPYMHEVCEPSIVFNPLRVDSIVEAFEQSMRESVRPSKNRIKNQIAALIALLN